MGRQGDVERRFWSSVEVRLGDGCWLWVGHTSEDGYGQFSIGTRKIRTHRFAFELVRGAIPPGLVVRHVVCRNKRCVNPGHLDIGTQQDNVDDARRDGTLPQGERHGSAKLTEADVVLIRQERAAGVTPAVLARRFGISAVNIRHICSRRTWRNA